MVFGEGQRAQECCLKPPFPNHLVLRIVFRPQPPSLMIFRLNAAQKGKTLTVRPNGITDSEKLVLKEFAFSLQIQTKTMSELNFVADADSQRLAAWRGQHSRDKISRK